MNRFETELDQVRRDLAAKGREVKIGDAAEVADCVDGIVCDFDLPYSTLPPIRTRRWKSAAVR